MQWEGEVVVTDRWIDQFPPRNTRLTITSLTFKRYGRFDAAAFETLKKSCQRIRYQCCRVPWSPLLEVLSILSTTLRHVHIHCLDPGVHRHPSVTPLLSLPALETLDITLAVPEAWGIVYIVPPQLSRSLETLTMRGSTYVWCENEGAWPVTLHHLELETTEGIMMRALPKTLTTVILHSPRVRMDDDIFGTPDEHFPYLCNARIRTRGAFGLQWLRRVPQLERLDVQSDTIIVDASLGFPKKLASLSLESLAYFAMTALPFATFERLRAIEHTDFRAIGGKRISIDAFL